MIAFAPAPDVGQRGRTRHAAGREISHFLSHNRKLPEVLIILRCPAPARARTLPGRANKPSFGCRVASSSRIIEIPTALRHPRLFAFVGESPWIAVCPIRSFSRVSPHSSY